MLFGREVSFKDTPVEKVRRVHYSHSYRIELPDRREWKDILLKELKSLWESVVDSRRKVIDTLRDIVWDRQDERERKEKEDILYSEYTRISKQDFDTNVGVQYSVLMGFKKKTYTAIEEKEEDEDEGDDYEEENNYTENYEEEDFDDDTNEYEEKEYRWSKYRCYDTPEYENYDPNEFEVY